LDSWGEGEDGLQTVSEANQALH